jgi:hypothetical protein
MIPDRWTIQIEEGNVNSKITLRKRRSTIVSDVHTTTAANTMTNSGIFKNPIDKSGKYTALFRVVQNGVSKAADDEDDMYNYKADTIKRLFDMWDQGLYVNLVPVKPVDMPVAVENISTIDNDCTTAKPITNTVTVRRYSEDIIQVNESNNEPVMPPSPEPAKSTLIMANRRGRPNEQRLRVKTINATHNYKKRDEHTDNYQKKAVNFKLLKKDTTLLRDFFSEILEKTKKQFIDNFVSGTMKMEEEFLIVGDLTKRAKMLYDQIMSIDVDEFTLNHYFSEDGYIQLMSIMSTIEDTKVWTCYKCDEKLEETAIGCDYCNEWWHLQCAKLKSAPKASKWFCVDCKYRKK